MKNKILSFLNFSESIKFRNILKWFVIGSLLIYLLISISAYASWFPNSLQIFSYNTKSGLILRILASCLLLISCFFAFVSYRSKINYRWLVVFLALLLVILFCIFYTPTYYNVLYRTTKLYDFMAQYETSVSTKTIIEMYFSFAIDILFGYCFIFVLPHCFDKKEYFLYLFIPFVLIMLYSVGYSFIKEKDYYINFIKGNWSYNAQTIGSIFGNKQQWGIFLAPALPICIISIFLLFKANINNKIKVLFSIFLLISSILFLFCTLAAFCKTAIIGNVLFVLVLFAGIILWLFINKKKKVIAISLASVFLLILILFVVFIKVDSFHQNGIGARLYKIINTLLEQGNVGASSRLEIMLGTLQNFPATNIFFGFSKGVLDSFVRTTVPYMNNGLHTGLAIYFGRTGIIGSVIYIILIGIVIWSIIKICKKSFLYGFIFFGLFISSFILNLGELEILIMSSSCNVYMINLAVVTLPISENISERNLINENV